MKFIALLAMICLAGIACAQKEKTFHVTSPNGKIDVAVSTEKEITWSVKHENTVVLTASPIALYLDNGEVLGKDAQVKSAVRASANNVFSTPIYKKAQVVDHYNQITLTFDNDFGLIFRVYDDGAAYRFFTRKQGEITVLKEQADFKFADDDYAFLPFVNDPRNQDKFNNSFEALYDHVRLSRIKKDTVAFLPVLVDLGDHKKAVILEADLQDYPGMYLTGGDQSLNSVFPGYPAKEGNGGYKNINYVVEQRQNFIAHTTGTRNFPWRVVVVSDDDAQLANSDMVQKLAEPSRLKDISWIKPGKVAWDWWNDWNITHVDFKAGINVPTYKYYIDFAAANHLEYIIIDEGWSNDADLSQIIPNFNLKEIVDYGRRKNIGVILWSTWFAANRNTDADFERYAQMGVKGFKIDFIDRDDQKMVHSLYELAGKAAARHLLIDYHGMFKPSGMQRTYPNLINFEGVKGLENVKWGVKDHPVYDVTIPFIRMMAGPMDYTPGAMRNATKDAYRPVNSNPMSQGTRCHQMAMYAIFEAPLQMLADNPTIYMREQECTDFIAAVPTTFDETVSLKGSVGEYIAMARRKGTTWYAGAMTSWTPRELTIDLSFLGKGNYKAVIFEDGLNADHDATDYRKRAIHVTDQDKLTLNLAPGGGWAARFEKE